MILVSGTGRCGTTWAYEVLNQTPYCVRHQSYRHEHVLGLTEWNDDCDIEVSFEAAPKLSDFRKVVWLWRDCHSVVESFMNFGVFLPGWESSYSMLRSSLSVYTDVLKLESKGGTPAELAAKYWVDWNRLFLENCKNAAGCFNIEGLKSTTLLHSIGYYGVVPVEPPNTTNTRKDDKIGITVNPVDYRRIWEDVNAVEQGLREVQWLFR